MKKYLVGIDIGGTTVKLGLFDLNGELLDKWEIETRKTEKGRYILSDIAKSIEGILNERKIKKESRYRNFFKIHIENCQGYTAG